MISIWEGEEVFGKGWWTRKVDEELFAFPKHPTARFMSEFFESLVSLFRKPTGYADEKPFQAEFFSVERLEQYAQTLASQHKTVTRKGRAQLLPRLEDNGRKLEAAYKALVEALREGRAISPAAEWLVDNYHIVEEQLREIRQDLPQSYYHELPKLAEGELDGYPRIYSVALELIAHTDSRLDTNRRAALDR
jgi:cyclic beta-1,2-glucan synthetase